MSYNITETDIISINYNTNKCDISVDIAFGKAKDNIVSKDENDRKYFDKNYKVEIYELGEQDENEYKKGYRVISEEGPLSIKLDNINILSFDDNIYDYALGFAIDNEMPIYNLESDIIPNNIERDGTMWTINATNNVLKKYYFDQNPKAKYQWVVKKAMDKNYKPSEKELELGMEETSEKTGIIYITFMIFKKKKELNLSTYYENTTRGATRGATRGGGMRGINNDENSVPARFGYGNEVNSSSTKSEYTYAPNTEKYILPIRFRIDKNSEISNVNCSKTIKGAALNILKNQTMTVPF